MRKFIKIVLFLPVLMLMLLTNCQTEIVEVTSIDDNEFVVIDSELTQLILNTTLKDGSLDNILDKANCSSVLLPVTVIANDLEIELNSNEDFNTIETVFNQFQNDTDSLSIDYPISIILSDYSELTIESNLEFNDFKANCNGENEVDADIECIDFDFPISFSIFNADFQISDSISIRNDKELYDFINELQSTPILASFNFPLSMILFDGSLIQVSNNVELETALRDANNTCDEDDDFDFDDDDFTEASLRAYLLNCPLSITTSVGNDTYVFEENGILKFYATDVGSTTGTWSVSQTNEGVILSLDHGFEFSDNGDWIVTNMENERIMLRHLDYYFFLEQNCDFNVNQSKIDSFNALLKNCVWRIETFTPSNNEVEENLATPIEFLEDNIILIREPRFEYYATYSITIEDSLLNLNINIENELDMSSIEYISDRSYSILKGDWSLESEDYRIFMESLGLFQGNNFMRLQRVCPENNSEAEAITQLLVEGEWRVDSFMDNNLDLTSNFVNKTLAFKGGTINVFNVVNDLISIGVLDVNDLNNTFTAASWFVYPESGKSYLEFKSRSWVLDPFNLLTGRWLVGEVIMGGEIYLEYYNANGVLVKTLVLKKVI